MVKLRTIAIVALIAIQILLRWIGFRRYDYPTYLLFV